MTVGHNGINNIRDGKAEWVADETRPDRRTADNITDDELDALYAERERLAKLHEAHLRVERRLAGEGLAARAAVERVREWANGDVVTGRNEFGNGYREAMRDVRDLLPSPAQRPIAATSKEQS